MNRTIKYRVWDHILSEWIKSDQLVLRPNGSITDGSILIDSKYIQFNTSLNDKNGKEIYEGDIIKEHHFEDWGDKIGYEYIGIVTYKAYSDDIFILFAGYKTIPARNQNTKFGGNAIQYDCIVIGNIFEHKHLLEK